MKVTKNKVTFKVNDVEYAVVRPAARAIEAGQRAHNRAFKEAIESDAILREQVDDMLKSRKLWDEEKQREADAIKAQLVAAEKDLARGYRLDDKAHKVTLKLSEAKKVALKMWELRRKLRELFSRRTAIDGETAQAQADNARFHFLVSQCLVYNSGEKEGQPVFRDSAEYLERATEPVAYKGAGHLAGMLFGGADPDWEKRLPENQFLLKYNLVDEQLRLIDRDGQLVDEDGRRVNEDGHYVNDQNELVTRDGERVDENGNFVFSDRRDFLDDLHLTGPTPTPAPAAVQAGKHEAL